VSAAPGLKVGGVALASRVLIAPMTGVSDLPFRETAAAAGAVYTATEMVACAEFARGRPDVVRRAAVGEGLPLTVIQLLGRDPALIAKGAAMAAAAGADIVDLNMGCPAKEVAQARCGAALMCELDLAERLIGAAAKASDRPVTVKMRLGWEDADTAPELALRAEAAGAAAVTIHARTRAQFYGGVADWGAVAAVRRAVAIPVIVNGDIVDAPSARRALLESGADAVMLGRGVYGRPWLAAALDEALGAAAAAAPEPGAEARYAVVEAHLERALAFYGDSLGLRLFRKHLGFYVEAAPFPAAREARRAARAALCRLERADEVLAGLRTLWAPLETVAA
jgi:nifR3 family TIM-barrel protein